MESSIIDIIVFAPLAPILGVLLFWFIQLLFIESEKYLLLKIRPKHEPLCRFTNFLGILFQTICHALGYTITKSGISDFYISISYGRVAPKKDKKGVFEWIANAFLFIGPFFVPAFLILLCLILTSVNLDVITTSNLIEMKYTFAGQLSSFGASLYSFSESFIGLLINIDLLHPGYFGLILFLIFLGMGIRPSYIGEKKQEKVDMLYDLKNIWSLITHRPLYIAILILISYIFFYISLFFKENWYVAFFSILAWLSIISIIAILIANLIIYLIRITDEMPSFWRYVTFFTMPFAYIFSRTVFYFFQNSSSNFLSLFITVLSTITVIFLALRYKTNKFKSKRTIKLFKKKDKGGTNE